MRKLACFNAPNLDDLLKIAASLDAGRITLDSYEIYDLVNHILTVAQANLSTNSKLRVGNVCLHKNSSGDITLHLRRCGLLLRSPSRKKEQSA